MIGLAYPIEIPDHIFEYIEKTGIEKALAEKIVQDVLKTGTTVRFGVPLEDR